VRSCDHAIFVSTLRVFYFLFAISSLLRFVATGAGLPRVPVAEEFHLPVEAGFPEEGFELGTG
jgi:hypothetical protein